MEILAQKDASIMQLFHLSCKSTFIRLQIAFEELQIQF